jgi:phosphoribosylanthranilate isomerase
MRQLDPYVGFSGVTTPEQAEALLEMAKLLPQPGGRRLMVGALTSFRGLQFGTPNNTQRYLKPEEIGGVFLQSRQLLNLIHYNSQAAGLFSQVRELVVGPTYCDGIQLNVMWPRADQLLRLRQEVKTQIVLQLSWNSWLEIGQSVIRLVAKLRDDYCVDVGGGPVSLIDRLLIDFSGGRGRPLDIETTHGLLLHLVAADLPIAYGVAGGLSADNLHQLRPLLEICPGLSWDMESGIRTDDQLDLGKCRAAWEASRELLA